MIDAIPSPSWSYYPGLWEQDMYTIPLEAGVIGLMNLSYTRAAHSVWPFRSEKTSRERESTRHPGRLLAPVAGGIAVTTLGVLSYAAPNFQLWTHLRGWVHAHLVNEMATSFSKQFFLRKRPFYDHELERSERGETNIREDDRLSFFSGHASHAFTFVTYASALLWDHAPVALSLPSTAMLYAGAGYVAAARAIDGQHNTSDVIVGGLVGTAIAYGIHARVNDVINAQGKQVRVQPVAGVVNNRWITGATLSLEF